MINFNEEKLNKILGGELSVHTDLQRMTARAITDLHLDGNSAEKFRNVYVWIEMAYMSGVEDGLTKERKRNADKIRSIFGI